MPTDDPHVPPAPARSAPARGVALLAGALWAAALVLLCAVKYRNFLYTDFDLAIFSQALFGALRGQWFSSIRGMYWLGDHSSLALLLLAPAAALWKSPLLLPVVQALALAAGAWPLFAYARRRLGDEWAATLCAALWLLQPALAFLGLFEFHPETLATPALLGVAAALAARRPRIALACAALAALAKEDAALPLAALGALATLRAPRGRRATGAAIVAIAFVSLLLSFAVLKPLLAHGEADYGAMYGAWGRSPAGIVAGLLRHPLAALAAFVHTPHDPVDSLAKAQLWLHLLGPSLFLSLLAPLTLLPALPVFAEHLLSVRIEQHSIVFQYTALTLPFVMLATVDGVARFGRGRPVAWLRARLVLLLFASLAAQALFGPLAHDSALRVQSPSESPWPSARERAMAPWRTRLQAALPRHGAIVADFPSLASLSRRDSLHSLHHIAAGHYTYSSRAYPAPAHVEGMLLDLSTLSESGEIDEAGLERVRAFARTRGLRVVEGAGDLLRLAPGARDTLAWLVPAPHGAHAVTFDGALAFAGGHLGARAVRPGERLSVATRWRRFGELPGMPLVQWGADDARDSLQEDPPRLLGSGLADPASWPAGATFEERTSWIVPMDLPPGTYAFGFGLAWRHGIEDRPSHPDDPHVRDTERVEIGSFRVLPR
jgi:uncharacterized membrane protein